MKIIFIYSNKITSIFISKEMRIFATSSLDGTINLINLMNGKLMRTINHQSNFPIHNVK